MATSSQGTYLSFQGSSYTVTSISVSQGQERERVRVAHMGLGPDEREDVVYVHKTQDNLPTVEIEWIGGSVPAVQASGTVSITGAYSFSGTGTCVTSAVRVATGDIIRGTASFRVVP